MSDRFLITVFRFLIHKLVKLNNFYIEMINRGFYLVYLTSGLNSKWRTLEKLLRISKNSNCSIFRIAKDFEVKFCM